MSNDTHAHTQSNSQPTRHPSRQIRWWWIGLCLAAILWFGSGIYRQHIQPLDEIEYESASLGAEEIAAKNQLKDRNHRRCQYGAIAIAIGSVAYLGRQLIKTRSRK